MTDLKAIRARDNEQRLLLSDAELDRSELLREFDKLAAAARKVKCAECGGTNEIMSGPEGQYVHSCDDCADLRAILEKTT